MPLALSAVCRAADVLALRAYYGYRFKAGHIVAHAKKHGEQLPRYLCGLLKHGLISLVGKKQLALAHIISDFFEPFADHTAFHRLSLSGHYYRRRHTYPPI